MTEYKYEIRYHKRRFGAPILVPYSEVSNYTGFRSSYGYPPEVADKIANSFSTAGLGAVEVYSSSLLVDFDDCPEAALAMADMLSAYQYVLFDSGGRSLHLHIAIEPMLGTHVPHWQKMFVKSIAPQADLSIYKHTGIFRLPGTHHSNGRVKHALKFNAGAKLSIPEPAIPMPSPQQDLDEDQDLVLMWLLDADGVEGERNKHVFQLARTCAKLGMPRHEAEELIAGWNQRKCHPPLQGMEMGLTINSGYRV